MSNEYQRLPYRRSLAGTLLAAREAVMAPIRPQLRDVGLTEQQWRVLRILVDEGEVDLTSLAHSAILQPASLSRMIRDMEARGLIEREADLRDKRRAILHISSKGRDIFERASAEAARLLETYNDYFGKKRLDALRHELIELTAVLSRLAPPEEPSDAI